MTVPSEPRVPDGPAGVVDPPGAAAVVEAVEAAEAVVGPEAAAEARTSVCDSGSGVGTAAAPPDTPPVTGASWEGEAACAEGGVVVVVVVVVGMAEAVDVVAEVLVLVDLESGVVALVADAWRSEWPVYSGVAISSVLCSFSVGNVGSDESSAGAKTRKR